MLKKIFTFLTTTRFGLLLMVNLFFIAGLFGATGYFIGGLIWFTGNVFFMFITYAADFPKSNPSTGGGGGGTVVDNNKPTEPTKPEEEQQL